MLYIVTFRYKDESEDHEVKFRNQMVADNFHQFMKTNPYIAYINLR